MNACSTVLVKNGFARGRGRGCAAAARPGLFAASMLVVLAGCATPGNNAAERTHPATETPVVQHAPGADADAERIEFEWHDPKFFEPWFDPSFIVLPPPPFTGLSAAGKAAPMLPNRSRPAGAEGAGAGSAPAARH